jgi:hypothetical protein
MRNNFDTVLEQIYNTFTASKKPVSYTLPNILTTVECDEVAQFFEKNSLLYTELINFLNNTPKPSDNMQEWLNLWNKISEEAYTNKALPSIIVSTGQKDNNGALILTPESEEKRKALRDYIVMRFTGSALNDVNQQHGRTVGNEKETLLQTYDKWLSNTNPDNHTSYQQWYANHFK